MSLCDLACLVGATSAVFEEDVSIQGLYGGTGHPPWLFCTSPGSGATSKAADTSGNPINDACAGSCPAPDAGPVCWAPGACGVQPLDRFCYDGKLPTTRDQQWTLVVTVTDQAGHSTSAEIPFGVYQGP